MSDETGGGGPWQQSIAGVIAALATAGAIYLSQGGFESSRPEVKPWEPVNRRGEQPIEARLWEDPIAAVARASKEKTIKPTSLKGLGEQVSSRLNGDDRTFLDPEFEPTHVRILIVATNTRRYMEDAEDRMRERSAVTSALAAVNFAPNDSAGIGIADLPQEWGAQSKVPPFVYPTGAQTDTPKMPYEWFRAKIHAPHVPWMQWLNKRGEDRVSHVLVLWLDEHLLKKDALSRLARIMSEIQSGSKRRALKELEVGSDEAMQLTFHYLGPTTSEYLRRFLPWDATEARSYYLRWLSPREYLQQLFKEHETGRRGSAEIGSKEYLQQLSKEPETGSTESRVYVKSAFQPQPDEIKTLSHLVITDWGATMAEELLVRDHESATLLPKDEADRYPNYRKLLAECGPQIRFSACDDEQLACEILAELKRRRVTLAGGGDKNTEAKVQTNGASWTLPGGNKPDQIVLLSEWDSDWGRLFPLTLAACIRQEEASAANRPSLRQALTALQQHPPKNGWPDNVHFFSYERGMDGKVAGPPDFSTPSADDSSDETSGEKSPRKDIQHPVGPSQIDSIPRLAEELKSLRRRLTADGHGEIRAIGVLGSDIYDKLLILQAVRTHFPEALVFTTDLDARYWHPTELKASRNLLVASSFGLRLHPNLQGGIPPFRDSRQTALFNATIAALLLAHGENSSAVYHPFQIEPRVFEIGTGGPVNLSRGPVIPMDRFTYTVSPGGGNSGLSYKVPLHPPPVRC